jgi:hypothetical protein
VKALTVHQGWASAIFESGKNIENRSWRTDYRGTLLIHAGKSKASISVSRQFHEKLGIQFPGILEFGAVLGTVQLVDCVASHSSDWAMPGYWHWVLENPQKLSSPLSCNGKEWLWVPQPLDYSKILCLLDEGSPNVLERAS